jgi:hypothetical protein
MVIYYSILASFLAVIMYSVTMKLTVYEENLIDMCGESKRFRFAIPLFPMAMTPLD